MISLHCKDQGNNTSCLKQKEGKFKFPVGNYNPIRGRPELSLFTSTFTSIFTSASMIIEPQIK